MKKILTIIAAALMCMQLSAQTETEESFRAQYIRQTKAVGPSGSGVDYILGQWEKAFPKSREMFEARFSYFFDKCKVAKILPMDKSRFMGESPKLSLTDSLGKKVNYFQEFFYDDELFGTAMRYLDKGVELNPDELSLRFDRITALISYEKESPDMATGELLELIDLDYTFNPSWTSRGQSVDKDYFISGVQEYCFTFFNIASPASYDSFRAVSEKMVRYYPKETVFLSNLGSYYLIAEKNNKKALSFYKKVLAIEPKDYIAAKNCVLLARKTKDVKLEKKYLPFLIESTPSEGEKMSAQARLTSLQ